ncbi:MAG: hypothetical protein SNI58_03830 [Rikenellaceae bacterium]
MIEMKVDSSFERYSHYHTIVMCGGFDSESKQLYVESTQKEDGASVTRLEMADAHHIEVIIYFIPKLTPVGKNRPIVDHPPFDAQVSILSPKREIHNKQHKINAWGGAAIKLKFEI